MKRQGIIQRNQLNYTLQSIPTMNYNDEYSSSTITSFKIQERGKGSYRFRIIDKLSSIVV